MTVNEFAQLLQNEMILPRDPHLVARFIALLDEYFASADPLEPTAQDGVSVDLVPNTTGPIPITDIPPSTYSAPAVVREPTPEDGINIVPQEPTNADYSTLPLGTVVGRDNPAFAGQEPRVADPTLEGTSATELAPVTEYSTPVDTPALESEVR